MILVQDLQKIQKGVTALDIDEIQVTSGEIVALTGTVGSGLSTFMDILLGKSTPSAGQVKLAGANPHADKTTFSQKVGVLFKDNALYPRQSAENNLLFFTQLHGLPKLRALEVLKKIGLGDQANTPAEQLSSGLGRRLAFGRAILNKPEVLILQSPLKGCDDTSLKTIKGLIQQEAKRGAAILILDNDVAQLEDVCDRIIILHQGRISEIRIREETPASQLPFKIPVKLEGRVALLNPGDILFAEAYQGKTLLKTIDTSLPTQFTLNELEERLKHSGFFRAHRAYLVNLQHVREVIPYSRDSFSLRLNDEQSTEIPLSKSAAADLRTLLDY